MGPHSNLSAHTSLSPLLSTQRRQVLLFLSFQNLKYRVAIQDSWHKELATFSSILLAANDRQSSTKWLMQKIVLSEADVGMMHATQPLFLEPVFLWLQ